MHLVRDVGMATAATPVERYVSEHLRRGLTREQIRVDLDARVAVAISECTSEDEPGSDILAVMEQYFACRTLLEQSHLIEPPASAS